MKWFVLYVRSRSEKKVAQRLQQKGFTVFCPTKIEERKWSDRIKKVEVPYFRSYVFVQFEEPQETNQVLETPGVVRRLFWLGKPAIIKDREMHEVMAFFDAYQSNIEYAEFAEGQEVKIQKGALKDKKGIVLIDDKTQVTLYIPALNSGFKVNIHKNKLGKTIA